ncbi:MAG: hypothetical protein F4218_10345 [Synechococcus sp. SB0677_bin_5]|nr:hypothetical protein [Synechococcus sp. SB0677_bin_5]
MAVAPLAVGDPIVLVATAVDGRGQALASCQAILESLKHHAPFWKKELGHAGERWIPGNMPYGSRQPAAGMSLPQASPRRTPGIRGIHGSSRNRSSDQGLY